MHRIALTVAACGLMAGACVYRPTPASVVHVVDSPVDVTACRFLGELGGPQPTGIGFEVPLTAWRVQTAALGGNTLYLAKRSPDWAYVTGRAYRCRWLEPFFEPRDAVVVRARG